MAKILDPVDIIMYNIFKKFGYKYNNGEFHKYEDNIHYVLYCGRMIDILQSFNTLVYTLSVKTVGKNDEILIRDIPENIVNYLTYMEREKSIDKIIN